MLGPMVRVPPGGPVDVTIVDRRTGDERIVTVAPFLISETAVTVAQWHATAGEPAEIDRERRLPMVEVSWREAVAFCNEASRRSGLTPVYTVEVLEVDRPGGWAPHDRPAPDDWSVTWDDSADGYRLPTEAEWQLACRAGTTGPHYGPLESIAWFAGNSGLRRREVAGKAPNAWGLFDTLGGVWEWCWDVYDPHVYGSYRTIRGGGWADPAWSCRAGVRRKSPPTARLDDLGFRLARSIRPESRVEIVRGPPA